jgi:hypothetical protein
MTSSISKRFMNLGGSTKKLSDPTGQRAIARCIHFHINRFFHVNNRRPPFSACHKPTMSGNSTTRRMKKPNPKSRVRSHIAVQIMFVATSGDAEPSDAYPHGLIHFCPLKPLQASRSWRAGTPGSSSGHLLTLLANTI